MNTRRSSAANRDRCLGADCGNDGPVTDANGGFTLAAYRPARGVYPLPPETPRSTLRRANSRPRRGADRSRNDRGDAGRGQVLTGKRSCRVGAMARTLRLIAVVRRCGIWREVDGVRNCAPRILQINLECAVVAGIEPPFRGTQF